MRCVICFTAIVPEVSWGNVWKLPEKEWVCDHCSQKFERINKKGCPLCSRNDSQGICFDCERWEQHPVWQGVLSRNSSVFHYNDFAKEVVARWKYRGDYQLITAFEKELHQVFADAKTKDLPLVPIPLSKEREVERGFNQAEAVIESVKGQPYRLLERRHTEKQAKKDRKNRIHSENPFFLIESPPEVVVLVDDIYTTGTTLRHAASLLRKQGSRQVYSLTLFR
ncbi:ComF family protein [Halobacillus rhizosphaerae]|uniref:ComF family protein n=1 Tax=Halobacillus rhizosphaerae TaxID=3064889 RepID=UPI00398A7D4C